MNESCHIWRDARGAVSVTHTATQTATHIAKYSAPQTSETWETVTAVILATAGERSVACNMQFNIQDNTHSATRTLQYTVQRTLHHKCMKSGIQWLWSFQRREKARSLNTLHCNTHGNTHCNTHTEIHTAAHAATSAWHLGNSDSGHFRNGGRKLGRWLGLCFEHVE